MTTMWEIVRLPLVEAMIVGALCGLIGALAVLRHRVFFAESVTHGAFPGAVLGVVAASQMGFDLSISLFVGAVLMCIPLAALMYGLAKIAGQSSQAAAGIVITVGFSLGYFLAKWFAPLPLKIEGFLTGSVLTVRPLDVWAAAGALVIALLVVAVYGDRLVFLSFDQGGYRAGGHSVPLAESIILGFIVMTVVVVIPAVGTIVSIALIAAPAAGMKMLVHHSWWYLVLSAIAGTLISMVGLWVGVTFDLSVGGMIAVVAGAFYVLCVSTNAVKTRLN